MDEAERRRIVAAYGEPVVGRAVAFRYEGAAGDRPRAVVPLCRTASLVGAVQVLAPGAGERRLHSHPRLDGFWFVLGGRVRFHGEGGELADLGPLEGVLIPRGVAYWFENPGPGRAELLQVEGRDAPEGDLVGFFGTRPGPADHHG